MTDEFEADCSRFGISYVNPNQNYYVSDFTADLRGG